MFTDEDRALLRRLSSVVAAHSDDRLERADRDTGTASMRFAAQEIWEDTHYLRHARVPLNNLGKERWPNEAVGYSMNVLARASYIYDRALYDDMQKIVIPLVQQIRAGQGDVANQEVLDQIQAMLEQAQQQRQAIGAQLDALAVASEERDAQQLALIEQALSGEKDAADVLRALAELIQSGLDGDSDDPA